MPRLSNLSIELARGLLLLGVFYVHALHWLVAMHGAVEVERWGYLQIKLLGGYVVLFFALAGMTSRNLADKPLSVVAHRSLMLLLLGAVCHVTGVLLDHAAGSKEWVSLYALVKAIGKPLVYGDDLTTFSWFFFVLAIVRAAAWLLLRHWRAFLSFCAIATLAITVSLDWNLTPNLWGWRHWPAALLLFLIGMRVPAHFEVPHRWGLPLAAVVMLMPLLNSPWLLRGQWCIDCDHDALIGPAVGEQGTLPVLYFVQSVLAVPGLVWLAGTLAATPLARGLAYIGRHSLPLLVLHGWLTLLYGWSSHVPISLGVPWVFVAVFVAGTTLHLALFWALKDVLLDRLLLVCSLGARRTIALATALWPARLPLRRRSAP